MIDAKLGLGIFSDIAGFNRSFYHPQSEGFDHF